jgi:phytoene synthase
LSPPETPPSGGRRRADATGADAAADLAACRALLRDGSRSFHAASMLLPARVRGPASALYAFCRVADDAVDCGGGPRDLDRLRDRLEAVYAGRPEASPVDRAFARIVEAHALPRALPEALLEGFAWDLEGRRYPDFISLEAYCTRVAGTVGLMMTLLMGRRTASVLARAADLGIAMQLTNIARDVGEDARAGRLYLPLDWMADAGLDPDAFLAAPRHDARLARVVRRLLALADAHYRRAADAIAHLPLDCRPAIRAAMLIYAEIGAEIAARGHDAVSSRARTGGRRKLALMAKATAMSLRPQRALHGPAAPTAHGLVQSISAGATPRIEPRFSDRVAGVIEMFDRLERQRLGLAGGEPRL